MCWAPALAARAKISRSSTHNKTAPIFILFCCESAFWFSYICMQHNLPPTVHTNTNTNQLLFVCVRGVGPQIQSVIRSFLSFSRPKIQKRNSEQRNVDAPRLFSHVMRGEAAANFHNFIKNEEGSILKGGGGRTSQTETMRAAS